MRRTAPVLLTALAAATFAAACSKKERSLATPTDVGTVGQVASAPAPAPAPPPIMDRRAARMRGAAEGAATGAGGGISANQAMDAAVAASAEIAPAATVGDVTPMLAISQASDSVPVSARGEILDRAMVIRTGTAVLEVHALDSAITRARLLAMRLGGYVGNTVVQGGKDQPRTATLELKFPAARFDEAVSGLQPLGKVESVNVTADDVSEEYVDVAARVANAHRLEEQLVRLLERRTGRLSDALDVERELSRVREQIERYEGRMRWLRTRAAVSTLSVSLHEPMPLIAQQPGENPIRDAFGQAWRTFVDFVAGAIASLGVLVPLGLIAFVAWTLWRRFGPSLAPRPAASRDNPAA